MSDVFPDRMGDHKEQDAVHFPIGAPALLGVLNTILEGNEERIEKNSAGCFKTDAMLSLVGKILPLVPLKLNAWHNNIVTTNR